MRSPFLRMLMGSRERPPRPSIQERLALLAARSSWDVQASPINPPKLRGTPAQNREAEDFMRGYPVEEKRDA
jgi:hypothetical protein